MAWSPGDTVPAALAVLLVIGGCAVLGWEARGLTFRFDEWSFILWRPGISADSILAPHNEHLSALPVLAYKLLMAVFGLGSYAPYMALLLSLHAATCLLLYALARRYVGQWAALIPVAVMVVLGPAWEDLIWAFQIGYLGSVAAGLGMLLCLERRTPRGDIWAGVLLGASLLCSSIGLGMVIVGAAEIVLSRPRQLMRLRAIAVPLALYVVWYAFYGVSTADLSNVPRIPGYVLAALASVLASVTGLGGSGPSATTVSDSYGYVLAAGVLAVVAFALIRGWRPGAMPLAAAIGALALWVAQALSYIPVLRDPQQVRYQYTGAALVMLAAAGTIGRRRIPVWGRGMLVAATAAVCVANTLMIHHRVGSAEWDSSYVRAELGTLEIARQGMAPGVDPDLPAQVGEHGDFMVTAGRYFATTDSYGSPAFTPNQIAVQAEPVREAVDLDLALAEHVPTGAPVGKVQVGASGGDGACKHGPGEVVIHSGLMVVRAGPAGAAVINVRRFADLYRFVHPTVPAGQTVRLRFPTDRSTVPWHVRVAGGPGLSVCTVSAR